MFGNLSITLIFHFNFSYFWLLIFKRAAKVINFFSFASFIFYFFLPLFKSSPVFYEGCKGNKLFFSRKIYFLFLFAVCRTSFHF